MRFRQEIPNEIHYRCRSRTRHAPAETDYKQRVQNNIRCRRGADEIKYVRGLFDTTHESSRQVNRQQKRQAAQRNSQEADRHIDYLKIVGIVRQHVK